MSVSATLISTATTSGQAVQSDVGRRYLTGAVQTGIGGIVSRVLQGFAPIILARYLGPKEYGVYTLVLSLVNICGRRVTSWPECCPSKVLARVCS